MRAPAPLALEDMPRRCVESTEREGRVVLQRNRPPAPTSPSRLLGWFSYLLLPARLRLDETGSEIWRRLDGRTTLAEIVNELRRTRGQEMEDLEQRVELFVRALVGQGFVEVQREDVPG